MFYDAKTNNHGLPHDPFKAIVSPRPIGWVSTVSNDGVVNLAPYSFFNAVSDVPPMVMIASNQRKDTLTNIESNGEFVCSMATYELHQAMNMSSAFVDKSVDEFRLAKLESAPSSSVKPPRVAASPASLECRLWQVLPIPKSIDDNTDSDYKLILGFVVGVYINDDFIADGLFDSAKAQLIARMGYMDYGRLSAENIFSLNRPIPSEDRLDATLIPGPWDGTYR